MQNHNSGTSLSVKQFYIVKKERRYHKYTVLDISNKKQSDLQAMPGGLMHYLSLACSGGNFMRHRFPLRNSSALHWVSLLHG